ncbi:hypothetical protein [Sphingobacterium sp. MYb382]|uniref:hypothetical protein n=1 Tax=Sphingobacterium sp. MYb382 TaxID=2745278 RepID=UPI0030B1EF6B
MSIIRITEGDFISHIEEDWKVFTETFDAYAVEGSRFTAKEGTVFGKPLKAEEEAEKHYFLDGWWSSDPKGNNRITKANIGQTVYFTFEMQNVADGAEILVSLFDYEGEGFEDEYIKIEKHGKGGEPIYYLILKSKRGTLPLTLSPGIEGYAANDRDDEIQLYFSCTYQDDVMVKLPSSKDNYLTVYTCDKTVVRSYENIGFGKCEFYQFRYNDFMRRHKDCGHVPPHYYYGPMLEMNEKTTRFYDTYALTQEMKSAPVNMLASAIKMENRNGVDTKPLLSHSYGFKYCVRFTQVLYPKMSSVGKDWLMKARKRLQVLMEEGLIDYSYEAKYDKIIDWMEGSFNVNFKPNTQEIRIYGNDDKAKSAKKRDYYKNIELINHRFQEFAFATHPEAYDPKKMSELPIIDLARIGLSPDLKEWIGEGAYGTWLQAAIVAANMDYEKLVKENINYYSAEDNNILRDAWYIIKEGITKLKNEGYDYIMKEDVTTFVKKNTVQHGD